MNQWIKDPISVGRLSMFACPVSISSSGHFLVFSLESFNVSCKFYGMDEILTKILIEKVNRLLAICSISPSIHWNTYRILPLILSLAYFLCSVPLTFLFFSVFKSFSIFSIQKSVAEMLTKISITNGSADQSVIQLFHFIFPFNKFCSVKLQLLLFSSS